MTRGSRSRWRPVLWTSGVIASVLIAWACNINPLGPYDTHDLIVVLDNSFVDAKQFPEPVFIELDGTNKRVELKAGSTASLRIGEIRRGEVRIFHLYLKPGQMTPTFTQDCEFTGQVSFLDARVVRVEFGISDIRLLCARW